jgi:hypothetical protein
MRAIQHCIGEQNESKCFLAEAGAEGEVAVDSEGFAEFGCGAVCEIASWYLLLLPLTASLQGASGHAGMRAVYHNPLRSAPKREG